MSEIIFLEDKTPGYAHRTRLNASADATLTIFVNFKTVGERLTRTCCLEQGKIYVPVNVSRGLKVNAIEVARPLYGISSLNIAGNGIYTMLGKYSQEEVDQFTYNLLKSLLMLGVNIQSIRTGGQTGFDEAGAKAGVRRGIPTTVLAPRGYKFRNILGEDISDEVLFKARFL